MAAVDEARQKRRVEGESTISIDSFSTFQMMEDLVDKLHILDYLNLFVATKRELRPLSRIYFAMPGKTTEQFPYFSALTAWLFSQLGHSYVEWNDYDDPTSVCNNILIEVKRLGLNVDFPAAKLRPGHGDQVCRVLDFLADRCLAKIRFQPLPPVHGENQFLEEAKPDEEAVNEDEVEEEVDDQEEEALFSESDVKESGRDRSRAVQDEVAPSILEAQVDPAEWKLELERVLPQLKFKLAPDAKEWRTHLEQTKKHEEIIDELFPDTKASLVKMGADLKKVVDRLVAKERHINRDFQHLGQEYQNRLHDVETLSQRYEELSKIVEELQNELAAKTDDIEALKSQMADRNNSITDTSPLRAIKLALANLKNELKQMEVRIGVAAQSLLQSTLKEQRAMGSHSRSGSASHRISSARSDMYSDA
eukprot:TRINITY_DN2492_c0_g2_i2.p1 TRINITY_DN2492_c0_g2~~TRINITY_DN2492_c0_g2_i2.p1  ORF type:complete len:421 (+),score=104.67 TRINITY_DN2492_c0_g2_i2:130-1392(+)